MFLVQTNSPTALRLLSRKDVRKVRRHDVLAELQPLFLPQLDRPLLLAGVQCRMLTGSKLKSVS
jgi:hypothetical protein